MMPLVLPMSATEVFPLIHVPPIVMSESVAVEPSHITGTPEIAAGTGLTVITVVEKQPVGNLYVTVEVPVAAPVTSPVILFTVTIPLAALHVPAGVVEASVIVEPTQTEVEPVIAAGSGFTVACAVLEHPVEVNETEIVDVPALRPVSV